jgi:hypothetical protein
MGTQFTIFQTAKIMLEKTFELLSIDVLLSGANLYLQINVEVNR